MKNKMGWKTLEYTVFRSCRVAALLALVFVSGCRNHMEPPAGHDNGKDPNAARSVLFSMDWGDATRTIMPAIPKYGDERLSYVLLMEAPGRNPVRVDLDPEKPVSVTPGTWDLTITVFISHEAGNPLPFAQWKKTGVEITADGPNTQIVEVSIRPEQLPDYKNETGTFRWRLYMENEEEKVKLKTGDPNANRLDIVGVIPTGYSKTVEESAFPRGSSKWAIPR